MNLSDEDIKKNNQGMGGVEGIDRPLESYRSSGQNGTGHSLPIHSI